MHNPSSRDASMYRFDVQYEKYGVFLAPPDAVYINGFVSILLPLLPLPMSSTCAPLPQAIFHTDASWQQAHPVGPILLELCGIYIPFLTTSMTQLPAGGLFESSRQSSC